MPILCTIIRQYTKAIVPSNHDCKRFEDLAGGKRSYDSIIGEMIRAMINEGKEK